MFNDKYGLTKAVLDGRKTQTRRIINPQPMYNENIGICWKGYAYGINLSKEGTYNNFISGTEYDKSCKRYREGEVIAVAQNYGTISESISKNESIEKAQFYSTVMRACYPDDEIPRDKEEIAGWNNKMFVKPELMPHQIRITKVRIQKLQDISDEDCLAEGIEYIANARAYYVGHNTKTGKRCWLGSTPRKAYAALIDKVSGKGTWDSNPYVWVYEFKLIK